MANELEDPKKIPFNPSLKTVLYIKRDEDGCGYYRCYQPALALRRTGLMNAIVDMQSATPEHIKQADIVVFQALGTLASIEAMDFAIKEKKTIVAEVDDYLQVVSPNNPGYTSWHPGNLILHRALEQIKKADAMTVSTPQLAREYFPFNPNIYILPNYLSKPHWDDLPLTKKRDGIIRIGWAGGNAHADDLRTIAPVIEKLVKEYAGKVRFETMGMTKAELSGVFKMQEFFDLCPKCGYQGEMQYYPGEKIDEYPQILCSYGWDIAVAPILNTAFNCSKSDLKLKEYSAVGYPVVASRVQPYIEAQEHGANVRLASTFKEWYNYLKELIENPELRDKIAKDNKEWIKKYWMDDNAQHYHNAYQEILTINKNSHGSNTGSNS